MNLDNLNLVELNAQEVQEIKGGDFGIVSGLIVGALIGWALSQDLDKLAEAYNHGYNMSKK
ncbi:bacteriocin [Flavobacterium glaciei]|uniref:Lactobin A/cerein 7B family class IIb bacteriocin n=1 Tax=Flavobacterium glaciei TaxID=386300 RepID=A0A562PPT8_9FLAO|nr:bacteriocin [Flavobacterium glaciei]RDI53574.1 hypothetical protein DFR66_109139 [Flavobacterium glaciei]TWI46475.1 hypothetical protein IQ02_01999 [Flavobacterium glaciei]